MATTFTSSDWVSHDCASREAALARLEAHPLGVPTPIFARMLFNVAAEGIVGHGADRRRCLRRRVPRQPPQRAPAARLLRRPPL